MLLFGITKRPHLVTAHLEPLDQPRYDSVSGRTLYSTTAYIRKLKSRGCGAAPLSVIKLGGT